MGRWLSRSRLRRGSGSSRSSQTRHHRGHRGIRMKKKLAALLTILAVPTLIAQTPASAPRPAVLQNYPQVTSEQLKKPADGDWLMVRRTYDGWGYSPLEQITKANVARLQPVWSMSTGVTSGHQAPPVVNAGVMFVATPQNQVLAIDARTGAMLWRYRR